MGVRLAFRPGECVRIDGTEACGEGDALAPRLKPRRGAAPDVANRGECLDYHLPKVIGD